MASEVKRTTEQRKYGASVNYAADADNKSDFGNELLYTGRRIDPATGLQLNRNRFYHQQLGRWVSRDPIGYEAGDLNLYGYVGGMPLTNSDPFGENSYDAVCKKKPDKDDCNKAKKLLTQYERIAKKKGKKIPEKRLKELNKKRDNGTITSNDLPGSLKSEFPGGELDGKELKEVRKICK